jgi:diguanylate cyclase (GGDEF)-like protein
MPTGSVDARGTAGNAVLGALGRQGVYEADHFIDVVALRRALASSELQLGAALRELERVRRRESQRQQEAEALEKALLKAQSLAYHDELTRLPSRHLLRDRFRIAAALADRHGHSAALLFIDLDGFKQVNDTLGHLAGDALLQHVATRVTASIRASDTACRYGGDEFVVLLSELSGTVEAMTVANDIRARLVTPYALDGAEIAITTSVGVAVYPADAASYDDLLRAADRAMYCNKGRRLTAPGRVDAPSAPPGGLRAS